MNPVRHFVPTHPVARASRCVLALSLFAWAGCAGAQPGSPGAPDASAILAADVFEHVEHPLNGDEWPEWRGPERNGVSRATGLVDSWATEGENLLWKYPVNGRSTPVVFDGRVYLIHLEGEKETWREEIVCLDADTGAVKWKHSMEVFHTDIPAERVGWTSIAGDPETGYVYANGVQGILICLDRDGKTVWSHSRVERNGVITGFGGRTHTPILDRNLVIISANNSGLGDHGKPMHRYTAYDKRTGEAIWWSAPGLDPLDTNYSCPVVADINGVRMLIGGNGDGWIHGMKIDTGEKVWSFQLSKSGINASVVVGDGKVYAMHSEDNVDVNTMGRVVCIDATGTGDVTKTHEVWRLDVFGAGYASPALHDGRLYALDNSANLVALDAKTGEKYWERKLGRVAKGSPVWADGKIFVSEVNGNFWVLKPGDRSCEVLSQLTFVSTDGADMDIAGSAAIAYGRIYFMTREAAYCVGKKDRKPTEIAVPSIPANKGAEPSTVALVTPAEVFLAPDGEASFKLRGFDAKGNHVGVLPNAQWTLAGLKGSVSPEGVFVPDPTVNGQFGTIEGAAGELKAKARVIVEPTIPMAQDFEKLPPGALPGYWIGASKVKFDVGEEEGNHFLRSKTDSKLLHSKVFFGSPASRNYVIQADVRGGVKRRSMPDIGLVNQRYVMDLRGNEKKIRIVGWISVPPRIIKQVEFPWEANVWYTMKMIVDIEGEGETAKGIVRGKVWKRGEPEPEAWTIEMEDPNPYLEGSPGLFCYPMAELHYDNVKVEAR